MKCPVTMDTGANVTCEVCQRISKAKPKPTPMQEREMGEVPSERVALDIVGPFP